MKFGINNPAFLQMAGNRAKPEFCVLTFSSGTPKALVNSVGGFDVKYMYGGIELTKHYDGGDYVTIELENDVATPIYLIGKITSLSGTSDFEWFRTLSSIDVSNAKSLEELWVDASQISTVNLANNTNLKKLIARDCIYLENLDLSQNPYITSLSISNNERIGELNIMGIVNLEYFEVYNVTSLTQIKAWAVSEIVLEAVADLIGNSTSSSGTVTLRTGDPLNSDVEIAAQNKGWTVEYVDA